MKGLACIVVVPYSNALLYLDEDVTLPIVSFMVTDILLTKFPVSLAGYSPAADAW